MRLLFCVVLATGLSGCAIPIPQGWHVVSGQNHSKEQLAFLDLPDATRDETVSTLGKPAWESHDARVLVYLWQMNYTWTYVSTSDSVPSTTEETDFRDWGLFIAYDEKGKIIAHEKRWLPTSDLELDCTLWASSRKNAPAK